MLGWNMLFHEMPSTPPLANTSEAHMLSFSLTWIMGTSQPRLKLAIWTSRRERRMSSQFFVRCSWKLNCDLNLNFGWKLDIMRRHRPVEYGRSSEADVHTCYSCCWEWWQCCGSGSGGCCCPQVWCAQYDQKQPRADSGATSQQEVQYQQEQIQPKW